MKGIQFIVDEQGEKTAVLINLKKHRALWEDIYDNLIAEVRRDEPRESIDAVEKRLRKQGMLDG